MVGNRCSGFWKRDGVPRSSCSFAVVFALYVLICWSSVAQAQLSTTYGPDPVGNSVNAVLVSVEGSFGALLMLVAGALAIGFAIARWWKSSVIALLCACSLFVLRATMATFFNDTRLQAGGGGGYSADGGLTTSYNDNRISSGLSWFRGSSRSAQISQPTHTSPRVQNSTASRFTSSDSSYQYIGGEGYHAAESAERLDVLKEPISTFSLDVDTGSYSNVRRLLDKGLKPPVASVRTEEFLNYFSYTPPVSSEGGFQLRAEVAPHPFLPRWHLLQLIFKAKEAMDIREDERGWNLVFLIDVSGSMSQPDKLPLLKRSLHSLVSVMRPQDTLSLVTYSSSARVVLRPTPGEHRGEILSALHNLQSGGSTNGSAGLKMAYDLAFQNSAESVMSRVILATDGDFNAGTYAFPELMSLIEGYRKSGVSLTTLGFGTGNYKEYNLEQLADRGNGNYFYIDSLSEARKVFGRELSMNLNAVAFDAKAQIEFNPSFVRSYRRVGYDNRVLTRQQFESDTTDAAEIGSGQQVTVLYEIMLQDNAQVYSDSSPPDRTELAFLKLRYRQSARATSLQQDFPLAYEEIKSENQEGSPDLRFAASVAVFAEVLKENPLYSDLSADQIEAVAQSSIGSDRGGDRQGFIELLRNAQLVLGR